MEQGYFGEWWSERNQRLVAEAKIQRLQTWLRVLLCLQLVPVALFALLLWIPDPEKPQEQPQAEAAQQQHRDQDRIQQLLLEQRLLLVPQPEHRQQERMEQREQLRLQQQRLYLGE